MAIDQPTSEHFLTTLVQMVQLVTKYFHGRSEIGMGLRALVLERLVDCDAQLSSLG
jgi:hypothetical protein